MAARTPWSATMEDSMIALETPLAGEAITRRTRDCGATFA
jgi:hypothetical protein